MPIFHPAYRYSWDACRKHKTSRDENLVTFWNPAGQGLTATCRTARQQLNEARILESKFRDIGKLYAHYFPLRH